MSESKHTPEQLLELIKVAATQFGRCCDLYQDGLGGFHCHQCGQATFRMLQDVQELIGPTTEVTHEESVRRATTQNAAPELLEVAKDFVDKVESGRARSKDSYAKFKAAIAKAEAPVDTETESKQRGDPSTDA